MCGVLLYICYGVYPTIRVIKIPGKETRDLEKRAYDDPPLFYLLDLEEAAAGNEVIFGLLTSNRLMRLDHLRMLRTRISMSNNLSR
jgi:hypothetical protein